MVMPDHIPIHSDPDILGGTLVFQGTRVPAQTLLDYLTGGFSLQEILEYFPSINEEDARESLKLAHAK
jgi:uncharacterized protein (DUF433 family)